MEKVQWNLINKKTKLTFEQSNNEKSSTLPHSFSTVFVFIILTYYGQNFTPKLKLKAKLQYMDYMNQKMFSILIVARDTIS